MIYEYVTVQFFYSHWFYWIYFLARRNTCFYFLQRLWWPECMLIKLFPSSGYEPWSVALSAICLVLPLEAILSTQKKLFSEVEQWTEREIQLFHLSLNNFLCTTDNGLQRWGQTYSRKSNRPWTISPGNILLTRFYVSV